MGGGGNILYLFFIRIFFGCYNIMYLLYLKCLSNILNIYDFYVFIGIEFYVIKVLNIYIIF